MSGNHQRYTDFIWSLADLLRGYYKQSEYGKVILPFTVLRRLDCVLAPTKAAVLAKAAELADAPPDVRDRLLKAAAGEAFYNTSELGFAELAAGSADVARDLRAYIAAFSPGAAEVLDKYRFDEQITRLGEAGLLEPVVARFAAIDLHPGVVGNHRMGYVFEELIRRFSEISNETAGEHFTPREVVRLMVNLLMAPDDEDVTAPGVVRTVYDPACGTGGMLSAAEEHIKRRTPTATIKLYGQELNPESWAVCRSDLMLKGHDCGTIAFGNSFTHDGHPGARFDYLLANPPFGVQWKSVRRRVEAERDELGWAGRFGAGTPRINDGSLLFLQHMIAKMKPVDQGGSRLAIVFNGSPLFAGAAGSGESEIRRWILANDWLEAVVALPDQLFYNTGISTYVWILSNRKAAALTDKVILLDGRDHWAKMRKSLGDKRKRMTDDQIADLTARYKDALAGASGGGRGSRATVKVLPRHAFGYQRITVERPLRQRFEVTAATVGEVAKARAVAEFDRRDALLGALRSLAGAACRTRAEFTDRLDAALREGGLEGLPAPVERAVWARAAVSDPDGEPQTGRKGRALPDPDLRDYENVPLTSMDATPAELEAEVGDYMKREVLPHAADAWVDHAKTKIGVEIPFTRHFHVYTPPRPLAEIDAELTELDAEIRTLLREVIR